MKYELPPLIDERGKNIAGLWQPARVLVDGKGDCDSKAVRFASLWLSAVKRPLVLIEVPGHVLLGILAFPGVTGHALVFHDVPYDLIEVSVTKVSYPPGSISPLTLTYLRGGRYKVEILN